MGCFQVRTDLALEARESIGEADGEIRGVSVEESYDEKNEIRVTRVVIETKNGAKAMGKPIGIYTTLEAPRMVEPDENYHQEISSALAKELKNIIPESEEEKSVLIVGLGNRDVTADALGPNVADNLFITRHVVKEYGKAAYSKDRMNMVSSIVPGVMAKTGMESAEIIKGVVEQTKPDVILVVDALAARSTKRLNRTIQVTNTGIHPGSGVGNHRNAITEESLEVPVVAIGVPTVVDAATIVNDAVSGEMDINLAELNNMYVTSKDVDYQIKQISHVICDAINEALEL
ncbi:GPR endopeptidase [Kineothrix sp. MB12-C1]|uniref:GPR endopeptidase n=1 Tax=Kineothrix sp. MB12-C1 TaxID=3070215 RepID=UPI0027D2632F|nr:GPR endopeptidase [Kineothrix sp. MB12-C1]WMC93032.1 GPR endopeptidase [Kineothrix sp. MB12-C1]